MDVRGSGRARFRGRRGLLIAVALVVCLAAAALLLALAAGDLTAPARADSPSASPASTSAGKTILRVGVFTDDLDSLNPFVGYTELAYEVYSQNYEFLVERRPEDFMPGPDGVAESWEQSADGKTWTSPLHEGLTWQDGQPLTADDVVFTYNYIIDNEIAGVSPTAPKASSRRSRSTTPPSSSSPPAQVQHPAPVRSTILPEHIWEQIPPRQAQHDVQERQLHRRRPLPRSSSRGGTASLVRLKADRTYWSGARPRSTSSIYVVYKNAKHHRRGPRGRPHRRRAQHPRPPSSSNSRRTPTSGRSRSRSSTGTTSITTATRARTRWATRCSRTSGSASPWTRRSTATSSVAIAYGGEAVPGTTMLPPDNWRDPDYHWQPPAGVLRAFRPRQGRSDARRGRLQGRGRRRPARLQGQAHQAAPVGPEQPTPRPRARPSSPPAGSRSSA